MQLRRQYMTKTERSAARYILGQAMEGLLSDVLFSLDRGMDILACSNGINGRWNGLLQSDQELALIGE